MDSVSSAMLYRKLQDSMIPTECYCFINSLCVITVEENETPAISPLSNIHPLSQASKYNKIASSDYFLSNIMNAI